MALAVVYYLTPYSSSNGTAFKTAGESSRVILTDRNRGLSAVRFLPTSDDGTSLGQGDLERKARESLVLSCYDSARMIGRGSASVIGRNGFLKDFVPEPVLWPLTSRCDLTCKREGAGVEGVEENLATY